MQTDLEKLNELSFSWLWTKRTENIAIENRRAIEEEILKIKKHNSNIEGSERVETHEYIITITNRIDRKVDHDILEEIVKEHDLTATAQSLFRWKPELKVKEWKNSHESITKPFMKAIDSKPGKPSFKITVKE